MKYILTELGERYLTRVNAQMIPMHLTKVMVGSGTAENLRELTELPQPKQRLQIETIDQDVNEAVIHCMLTNLELHEGYLLQQSGVYAYDALDDREKLIFIGQDEVGERIPPIEEREVQYLHNIAIRVSSTDKITFDLSVSDFVRKGYLEQILQEHQEHYGHVFVGSAETEIPPGSVLLILSDAEDEPEPVQQDFDVAGISNITLAEVAPGGDTENWGVKKSGVKIVEGRLVADRQPDSDTTFFTQI